MPTVSVLLTTYNRLALLREAVESVRAQTFGDWELIVADDGSDDGTAEYLEALARDEPRLVVMRMPHTARLGRIRNATLARARGTWVAFLDSDDSWRADKLQAHLDAHRAHPSARWSYSGRSMMDGAGTALPDARFAAWKPYSGRIVEPLLKHEAMIAFPAVVAERTLLEEMGGLDETLAFSTDYDLVLRLAVRAECICIPEPLVRVRVHLGSTTRGRAEVDESFIHVYRKFAAENGSAEVRRLCRRRQAFYARALARKHVAAGAWGRVAGTVLFGLRMDPGATAAWLGSALAGRLRRRPVPDG